MAVKRWRWPLRRDDRGRRPRDPEDLAARLAPLEETPEFRESAQSDAGKRANDTIRIDRRSVKVPEYLGEDERDIEGTFKIDAPVLIILLLFAAFIAFIAWQISLMPEK
ncbi:MAG TPA: hypothetical protein VEY09_05145 [Pyrinomonadaceae bacterium]|nr:hypothetical protein [Pyrinomonadaceae bacterium]